MFFVQTCALFRSISLRMHGVCVCVCVDVGAGALRATFKTIILPFVILHSAFAICSLSIFFCCTIFFLSSFILFTLILRLFVSYKLCGIQSNNSDCVQCIVATRARQSAHTPKWNGKLVANDGGPAKYKMPRNESMNCTRAMCFIYVPCVAGMVY